MDANDKTTYLGRANAWAYGEIGGEPPTGMDLTVLKTAVGMAVELFAQGETAQTDEVTGNITAAAPSGYHSVMKEPDPFDHVRVMLKVYKDAITAANTSKAARGIQFL
jgi:hypothetical protein